MKKFDGMTKFLGGNIFAKFYDLEKLKNNGFKYFDVVFPWQINREIVQKTKSLGISFGCFPLFFPSKKIYLRTIEKFGLERINSDFV